MRIGTIAYRTFTGLGYQCMSYVKHLEIQKIMVVDLSPLNGSAQNNWYPGHYTVKGYPRREDLEWFVKDLDVIILGETPLNYELYTIAKKHNVKVATVINWEFFDHYIYPNNPLPDMIIMPSVWHLEDAQRFCAQNNIKCVQLHHPVDRTELPFRKRTSAKPIHVAGKPAAMDRNGTWEFLQAFPDGKVVTQSDDLARHIRMRYRHSNVFTGITNQFQMYLMGDILVLPRKYGGNCLPLNEALSTGMPVVMPDISPNNHLLPKEWLVPATVTDSFTPRTKVDLYTSKPEHLRTVVENVARNITENSEKADKIADTISWETLKPKYLEALESML